MDERVTGALERVAQGEAAGVNEWDCKSEMRGEDGNCCVVQGTFVGTGGSSEAREE